MLLARRARPGSVCPTLSIRMDECLYVLLGAQIGKRYLPLVECIVGRDHLVQVLEYASIQQIHGVLPGLAPIPTPTATYVELTQADLVEVHRDLFAPQADDLRRKVAQGQAEGEQG